MKHRVAGRKLGRTGEHRLALLRNLSTALFEREKIKTTLMKAKELRPFAERLVTLSKRETLHARRMVLRHIHDRDVVSKLFDTLSARYAQRPGGYTRIIKLGPRRGDHAEMALIELVGAEERAARADEQPAEGAKAGRPKGRSKAKPAEAAGAEPGAGAEQPRPRKSKGKTPARKKAPAKRAAPAKPQAAPKKRAKTATKRGPARSGGGD